MQSYIMQGDQKIVIKLTTKGECTVQVDELSNLFTQVVSSMKGYLDVEALKKLNKAICQKDDLKDDDLNHNIELFAKEYSQRLCLEASKAVLCMGIVKIVNTRVSDFIGEQEKLTSVEISDCFEEKAKHDALQKLDIVFYDIVKLLDEKNIREEFEVFLKSKNDRNSYILINATIHEPSYIFFLRKRDVNKDSLGEDFEKLLANNDDIATQKITESTLVTAKNIIDVYKCKPQEEKDDCKLVVLTQYPELQESLKETDCVLTKKHIKNSLSCMKESLYSYIVQSSQEFNDIIRQNEKFKNKNHDVIIQDFIEEKIKQFMITSYAVHLYITVLNMKVKIFDSSDEKKRNGDVISQYNNFVYEEEQKLQQTLKEEQCKFEREFTEITDEKVLIETFKTFLLQRVPEFDLPTEPEKYLEKEKIDGIGKVDSINQPLHEVLTQDTASVQSAGIVTDIKEFCTESTPDIIALKNEAEEKCLETFLSVPSSSLDMQPEISADCVSNEKKLIQSSKYSIQN